MSLQWSCDARLQNPWSRMSRWPRQVVAEESATETGPIHTGFSVLVMLR